MAAFQAQQVLPAAWLARLTQLRVSDPEHAWRAAQTRQRRARLTLDGKLNLLAADHPARRVTAVGAEPLAMTDRWDYLARIVRVLQSERVDGVMATMDILEDLLSLREIMRDEMGGPAWLDHKLLIASLNRGGLQGVSWEMDDPLTGPTAATCAAWNLDGAKFLLRVCDDEPASLPTLTAAARAITETNALRLPMFLEPLPVVKSARGYQVVKTAEALAKLVGVASALGDSSRYLWLKLPYCENFEQVARATTLPMLLLGGAATGDPAEFMRALAAAVAGREIATGPGHKLFVTGLVRGALVGRNVLYPGAADPRAVAEAIGRIIHDNYTVTQALEAAAQEY